MKEERKGFPGHADRRYEAGEVRWDQILMTLCPTIWHSGGNPWVWKANGIHSGCL